MKCYNCGAKLGRENICPECGVNVKIYKKIVMASNEYYNDALAKASVRDLSGAIESLKTSLKFNKLNIDARNLLRRSEAAANREQVLSYFTTCCFAF